MRNPIFHRELIHQLRSGWVLLLQACVAVSLLVLARWTWSDANPGSPVEQTQQMLKIIGYGLVVVLMVLTPAVSALSIMREKQNESLSLVLHVPRGRVAFVVGKLLGSIVIVLLLLLLTVPTTYACYIVGGVDLIQLAMLYGLLSLITLQYAAFGLLVGAFSRSSETALRTIYLVLFIVVVVALLPPPFWQATGHPAAQLVVQWGRNLSPLPALQQVLEVSASVVLANQLVNDLMRYSALALGSSGACLAVTWLWLDSRTSYAVVVRGVSAPARGLPIWLSLLFFVVFGSALLVTLAAVAQGTEDVMIAARRCLAVLMGVVIMLAAPDLAGSVIAEEHQRQRWLLLRTTPHGTYGVVLRKLGMAMLSAVVVLAGMLPALAILHHVDVAGHWRMADVARHGLLSAACATLLCAAIGSLFNNVARAKLAALAVMGLVVIVLPAVAVNEWVALPSAAADGLLAGSPVTMTLNLMRDPPFARVYLGRTSFQVMSAMGTLAVGVLAWRTWRLTRAA